jgi:hypothetical protein
MSVRQSAEAGNAAVECSPGEYLHLTWHRQLPDHLPRGLPVRWFCLVAVLADGILPAILHGRPT